VEIPRWARQEGFDVRFDWGPAGVEAIATSHVVIVDVLRFTTAVEAAVSRGAAVYPYRWKDASVNDFADRMDAHLVSDRDSAGPSLSPIRLLQLHPGDRVVLPSPNGSTCAAIASERGATVVAACLRNARAVADWLNRVSDSVAVVACGERWPDGSLRPSFEDYLGAGAVIAGLGASRSPEASVAAVVWNDAAPRAHDLVRACSSGRELEERGWTDDLAYACDVHASSTVPILIDGAFTNAASL
jgi:2-phosphosulfolactate phosphatase